MFSAFIIIDLSHKIFFYAAKMLNYFDKIIAEKKIYIYLLPVCLPLIKQHFEEKFSIQSERL